MRRLVDRREVPDLSIVSIEDDKTSLCPGGFHEACPYENLYVYVLNGVLGESHEFQLGNAFMGNWVEDKTSILFFSAPADDEVAIATGMVEGLEMTERHVFPYEAWQGDSVQPVWVDHFVIVPPWVSLASDVGMKIVIDPGVVFGNCLHPTTRDCLRALSLAADETELGAVLDLGTGSGVLSVAAALLGADVVTGVDMNPLCVQTARRNIVLNDLRNVRMFEGDAMAHAKKQADLLIANIHHAVIKEILEIGALRRKKRVILSGLLRTQAREIKARLKNEGYNLIREWDHQMTWYTFLAEMKAKENYHVG